MSGGVDSSVAALLLQEQGFAVSGVHLRLLHNEDLGRGCESGCCSQRDAEDARMVAYRLGMAFYVFDFSDSFRQTVIRRFLDGYASGETPNPCMDCNRFLKWGELLHRAEVLGYSQIATGHYARVEYDAVSGRWLLRRGKDRAKDQSYFLSMLTQHQLSHTLLPLGDLTKPEVRAAAEAHGFCNAQKRDSQDLCFAPDGDYAAFWQRMTGRHLQRGNIIDLDGNVLGHHSGIVRYTLGQKKGLGISACQPLYVCAKNAAENTVTVGPESNLYVHWLTARDANWVAIPSLEAPRRVLVQIRSHQTPQPGVAEPMEAGKFRIVFDLPQRAPAPGQTVALYEGEIVLGAGTIDQTGT